MKKHYLMLNASMSWVSFVYLMKLLEIKVNMPRQDSERHEWVYAQISSLLSLQLAHIGHLSIPPVQDVYFSATALKQCYVCFKIKEMDFNRSQILCIYVYIKVYYTIVFIVIWFYVLNKC